jgi:hypothetical protein
LSYATDLADALDKVTMPGPVSKELRRLAAENESLVNSLIGIELTAMSEDPKDLAGIVKLARAAIASTTEGGAA